MRRAWIWGAGVCGAVAAALGSSVPGRAQATPGVLQVPLTYRPFTSTRELLDVTWGGASFPLEALGARFPGYSSAGKPGVVRVFKGRFPGESRELVGLVLRVADADPTAVPTRRLWIDWNSDRRFGDDEEVTAGPGAEPNATVFGPIERETSSGATPAPYSLVVHEGDHLHLVPAGCHEGDLKLGDRTVKVAVVDANANGVDGERAKAGQPAVPGKQGDLLLTDWNGDGSYTGLTEPWLARMWELEALPLRPRMQMPDGSLYGVMVARDGGSLTLTPDPAPNGLLSLPASHFALELTDAKDALWLRGGVAGGNTIVVPKGDYQLLWCAIGEPDPAGGAWSASLIPAGQEEESDKPVRIREGETTEWACGSPFRLALSTEAISRSSGKNFRLTLKDRAGNLVEEVRSPDGNRPAPPQLIFENPAGEAVGIARFAYGDEFVVPVKWSPPAGSKGTLTATASWETAPFAVQPAETPLTIRASRSGRRSYGRRTYRSRSYGRRR